jgi:hypothetical protein
MPLYARAQKTIQGVAKMRLISRSPSVHSAGVIGGPGI